MTKIYKEGALYALLDEYERAVEEFKKTIAGIRTQDFVKIVDTVTKDPDCVSIQAITIHTINAGYGYVYYLKKEFIDRNSVREKCQKPETAAEACSELTNMMNYTIQNLSENFSPNFEEIANDIFRVPWGQIYDFDQMMEHAIVHILRHRRQIEKFIALNEFTV